MEYQSVAECEIPLVAEVDVVIAGGSLAAVAAALAAKARGATVFLVAPRLGLGEDLVDELRLWREGSGGSLSADIFAADNPTTPLRIKKVLEDALCGARIPFVLSSVATQLILDEQGQSSGIVIANRAGRQAIIAKSVIETMPTRSLTSLQRADDTQLSFQRTVLGGQGKDANQTRAIPNEKSDVIAHTYSLTLPLESWDQQHLAELEQQVIDLTYRKGQLRAAERITFPTLPWAPSVPGHFRPSDRTEAAGTAAGQEAANWAAACTPPNVESLRVALPASQAAPSGELYENLRGLRPTDQPQKTVRQPAGALPLLAEVDVLVAGGGTSGISAGIAAARAGKSVLIVEAQGVLGGVGTAGLIGKAYGGQDCGHSLEVPFPDETANMEAKIEWFRREYRRAGGQIWFHTMTHGAWKEGSAVCGAYVTTPYASGLVKARLVIDATGSADIAIAAGADYAYGANAHDIAMQGTGIPLWPLGATYVNSDYLLIDETDIVDVTAGVVGMRRALSPDAAFDAGHFIQTRERRTVVGDFTLSYLDQVLGRTYPDSIVFSSSDYDSHGYPSLPYFALLPHNEVTRTLNHPAPSASPYTPYRCLLPTGLEQILVVGLGISMHRDASAMVRMQKDIHNQGYAAGLAAVMSLEAGCSPRQIDIKALQQRLVDLGALPASVLTDEDSYPLPSARIEQAVAYLASPEVDFDEGSHALAVIFTHSEQAKPLLRHHYASNQTAGRLRLACILGFLQIDDGIADIEAALADATWDDRILQGGMAEYAHLPTPVDALVLALGYSGNTTTIPAIAASMESLTADSTLSHHRSVALALEHLASPGGAAPLAKLLAKPSMSGHVMKEIEPLEDRNHAHRRREGPLREITLARALYRCGDQQGIGKAILQAYTTDIRALFARHAKAVLAS